MKAFWMVALVAVAACGTPDPEEGARCKTVGVTDCDFFGDVLICVDNRWEVQESCEGGTQECVQSGGEAVCSLGGEACDEEGSTKCVDGFDVAICDGQAWTLFSECFPDSCETDQGESFCGR